jgi:lipooligosaccharide transport system ATP-binding protein
MDEAEQVCDRLLVMDNGKIIAEGSPRELIDRYVGAEVLEIVPELNGTADERQWTPSESESESPELREVLKTCPNYQRLGDKYEIFTNECPNVLEAIRSRVKLASFSVRRATLEDVFIKLTGRELRD